MLDSAKAVFQKVSEAVWPPSRDALVAERDQLLAAVPPAPLNMREPPPPPACRCHSCVTSAAEEHSRHVTFGAWAGRLRAIETALFRLAWGEEDERDKPGEELAKLHGEIMEAADELRGRHWQRVVEVDGRGRPVRAFETGPALAEVIARLGDLQRAADGPMLFMGVAELTQALAAARQRIEAAKAAPLERPLAVEVAIRAGVEHAPPSEADRHGLVPMPGGNILEGTVRFKRRSHP